MHVTLIMVSTINGKITRDDDPFVTDWSSPEDMILFTDLKSKYNLIVMGNKTYQANKDRIKLSKNILRLVLTKNPQDYKNQQVPEQLEFIHETPTQLIKNLEARGYKKMLLVGGSEINALFFKDNLIDELHLTLEPYLFGSGLNIIAEDELVVQLQLKSVEKLNQNGTLHAIYTILKP